MKQLLALLICAPLMVFAADISQYASYGTPITPVKTTALYRSRYLVLHYDECRAPILSMEHLQASDVGGKLPRDAFTPDPDLPAAVKSSSRDYVHSGFDKGHLSPAEDFATNGQAMTESFYLSNMVPQAPKNNRIVWRVLENRVRKYAKLNGDVYIITGAIYPSTPKKIGRGVCVPDTMFKILIDKKKNSSIAFMIPNINTAADNPYSFYAKSVSDVEKASGINFTPLLTSKKILDKSIITMDINDL